MSSSSDSPGLSAEEAARGYSEALGGHAEHGRDIPPNRRRVGETDNRRAPTFDDDPEHRAQLENATRLDRETYMTAGYQPVTCTFCSAEVRVRKNSEKHTSVQWTSAAVSTCPMRAQWAQERDHSCPRLRQTIDHAYAEGLITLAPDVDPTDADHMVNPHLTRSATTSSRKDS